MKCSGCTWCCFHPAVKEFGKPIQEWCVHCNENGCSIYEDRPKSCSTYECVYFQDKLMPEEFRPDRCGVMFEIPYGSKDIYALVDPDRPNALKERRMIQLISKFNDAGYKVMIRSKDNDSSSI